MKKLINTSATNAVDTALLIARLAIAALMLSHGLPKMAMLLSGDGIQFPAVFGLTPSFSLGLAVFGEVICSFLIAAGFFTRLSVIPPAITMLVAIVSIHQADPFAKKELAVIYLVIYIILFFAGSGKYSIDYMLQSRNTKTAYAIS